MENTMNTKCCRLTEDNQLIECENTYVPRLTTEESEERWSLLNEFGLTKLEQNLMDKARHWFAELECLEEQEKDLEYYGGDDETREDLVEQRKSLIENNPFLTGR